MTTSNDKQRLFEVMGKVDKTFKHKLNENFDDEYLPDDFEYDFEWEYQKLIDEFGEQNVSDLFPDGIKGYIRSKDIYGIDAIKNELSNDPFST